MWGTFNHVVLNCGCTKSVCGEACLNSYIDTLSAGDKQKIVECTSDNKFKFGDDNMVEAIKTVKIPAQIRNKELNINTDVTNNELPVLPSKDAIRADTTIDFTRDQIF